MFVFIFSSSAYNSYKSGNDDGSTQSHSDEHAENGRTCSWAGSHRQRLRVNPISLSYPFPLPLPLSFARSRESKGCPNSHFDRGVGLRARGRYPLKPSIFASLLETKGYPEHTAQPATMSARSSRESHFRLK